MRTVIAWRETRVLAIALMVCASASYCQSAKKLFKQGEEAELKGDLEFALQAYHAAQIKKPQDLRYRVAADRVRTLASLQHVHRGEQTLKDGRSKETLVELLRALEIDPGNALAAQQLHTIQHQMDTTDKASKVKNISRPTDIYRPGPTPRLDALPADPITLHMTELDTTLYRALGKTAGINVLIDPEMTPKQVSIDLKDVTLSEALRALGDLSQTFYKVSTHNTIYVANDTRAKRTQLEHLSVRTFYLSNASQQQDANDIITTLRNVLTPTVKVFLVPTQNAVVIRGTPDELFLAETVIGSLDRPKPEVLVDVYVMEVRRDKLRNIGISLPTSLTVTSGSSSTLNGISETSSYTYSIGQAAVELLLTDSDTRVYQQPSLRAIENQRATLKIGQRIPVATGSYTTATSSTTSAVQTQFQYIDVGVNLDMTPTIHADRDVTLKLAVEVSAQSGTSTISGVAEPIISQQKAEQTIRLKDGEVSILAGLVQRENSHSVSGTPGVGEVPLLKYLFSTQSTEAIKDELIFMLIPHVVRGFDMRDLANVEMETGTADAIIMNRVPVAGRASATTEQERTPVVTPLK